MLEGNNHVQIVKHHLPVIFTFSLAGCIAFPIHDPVRFEAAATHAERTYSMPMDDMFECVMKSGKIGDAADTFATGNSAFIGERGLTEIWFKALPGGKTKVKASAIGHWGSRLNYFTDITDSCAAR